MLGVRLFNTLRRAVEVFVPLKPGEASLYTCGPTVYDYAHIGNLRTYVFEDVLRRVLEDAGLTVRHVMNVTDVGHLTDDADSGEDKMEKSSREKARSVWDIARFYTDAFFADFRELGCREPQTVCRATDHIQDMVDLIRRLETKGYTYLAGGNVYFDIARFPEYGKMALLDLQDLRAGARIEVDANKRNPHDFVLWFTKSKFGKQSMVWDSPWGTGHPGWHIECSAMSMKYLGEQFDIHCGGVDHIPVHHTNEIAQSEGATGKPWVNYWLHGEFLVMGSVKMSKSAGGFVTLARLKEEGYHPLDYRYLLLTAHYRTQLQFTLEALDAARSARRNLAQRLGRLKSLSDGDSGAGGDEDREEAEAYLARFRERIRDDLDTPRALGEMWALVKDDTVAPARRVEGFEAMDRVLGLDPLAGQPAALEVDQHILARIQAREDARKRKDFAEADRIRDELRTAGVVLEDTAQGVRWRRA